MSTEEAQQYASQTEENNQFANDEQQNQLSQDGSNFVNENENGNGNGHHDETSNGGANDSNGHHANGSNGSKNDSKKFEPEYHRKVSAQILS